MNPLIKRTIKSRIYNKPLFYAGFNAHHNVLTSYIIHSFQAICNTMQHEMQHGKRPGRIIPRGCFLFCVNQRRPCFSSHGAEVDTGHALRSLKLLDCVGGIIAQTAVNLQRLAVFALVAKLAQ